jgi:uncharacterized protein with HEPN domain
VSEASGAPRAWIFYLDDMIRFGEKVLAYTAGLDQAGFTGEDLIDDATLRNLEPIGEAATHVPEQVRAAHAEVPWRLIVATRNRLIQGDLSIDNDTLGASSGMRFRPCWCSFAGCATAPAPRDPEATSTPEWTGVAATQPVPPCGAVYRRDPLSVRIVRVWRSERLLRLPASAKSAGPLGLSLSAAYPVRRR